MDNFICVNQYHARLVVFLAKMLKIFMHVDVLAFGYLRSCASYRYHSPGSLSV
jgi:hypothetical protein